MAYQGQRGLNPVGLGIAIAINGGLLALAMMTATTIMRTPPDKPLTTTNIPIEVPPPPIPDEVKPVERVVTDPAPAPLPVVPPAPYPVPGPMIDSTDVIPPAPPPSMPLLTTPSGVGTGTPVTVATPLPVLVEASVDPRYRGDFQPDYPAFERNIGRDGVVVVRVLVGSNGRVSAIEPVRATSDAFFDATKKRALSKWRFRPAMRDGVAIESWRQMTVRFTMEDS